MNVEYRIRAFRDSDTKAVNSVALLAFDQFQNEYSDWPAFSRSIGNMAALSEDGELFVATIDEEICGAVVYVGPGRKKRDFFPVEWPILRMLVVAPEYRGQGIGRALTEACVKCAERDGATLIALHTTPIMTVALPMSERMGFRYHSDAPPIFGVPYGILCQNTNRLIG